MEHLLWTALWFLTGFISVTTLLRLREGGSPFEDLDDPDIVLGYVCGTLLGFITVLLFSSFGIIGWVIGVCRVKTNIWEFLSKERKWGKE